MLNEEQFSNTPADKLLNIIFMHELGILTIGRSLRAGSRSVQQ